MATVGALSCQCLHAAFARSASGRSKLVFGREIVGGAVDKDVVVGLGGSASKSHVGLGGAGRGCVRVLLEALQCFWAAWEMDKFFKRDL